MKLLGRLTGFVVALLLSGWAKPDGWWERHKRRWARYWLKPKRSTEDQDWDWGQS